MAEQSLDSVKKSKKSTPSFLKKATTFLGLFNSCVTEESHKPFNMNRNAGNRPFLSINVDPPSQKNSPTRFADLSIESEISLSGSKMAKIASEYPLDKVFILGEEYKMVVKIVNKKIPSCSPPTASVFVPNLKGAMNDRAVKNMNESIKIPAIVKQEIFSKFDKGIKATEWHEITPENVAVHIAKRLHCNIMVDALCGFGGNTIQFAKYCDYVLSIDIESEKTLGARHNAEIYGVHHKIDFLTVDFFQLKNLVGDVVFLGPSDIRKDRSETFSLFDHSEPDLRDLLPKSLEISFNIAMKLPGDTNLEELVKLFNVSLDRYGLYSKRFCVEVERILDSNDEVNCLVVYFGDCSSVEMKEEYEAIYEYISRKESAEWRQKFPLNVVATVLQKVGIRKFFTYITQIEQSFNPARGSVFEIFLETLVERNIFTKVSLRKLLDEGAHFPGTPSFLLTRRKSFSKIEDSPNKYSNRSPSVASGSNRSLQTSLLYSKNAVKSEPAISLFKSKTADDGIHENFDDNDDDTEEDVYEISPRQANQKENVEKPNVSRDEVSDLAVSSYSVSSSYFKDYSEDLSASPRENMRKETNSSVRLVECVDLTSPPDSLKASSFPEKTAFDEIENPSLRSLRMIKRGASQPARRAGWAADCRKARKSPDSERKRNNQVLPPM